MWAGNSNMNNWALQSQEYQNMNHEEVDWALLAKQWIQMKDSNTPVQQMPAAMATAEMLQALRPPPPPPLPQSTYPNDQPLRPPGVGEDSIPSVENSGAVDMEIEEDKEAFTQQSHTNDDAWKNWTYNTGEEWEKNQMQANWRYNYVDHNRLGLPGPPASNLMHGQSPKDQGNNYWSQQSMASSSGIMMQKVVDYGHRDRKVLSREPFQDNTTKGSNIDLDSNQRKQLPNWIRDGLEKMEREKHKLNEEERIQSTQKEMVRKKKEAEEKARRILQERDDGIPKTPIKSKFDSESENSDVPEEDQHVATHHESNMEKSFSSSSSSNDKENETQGLDNVLTDEEKLAQMIKGLKITMVEVMMDVTTKLISEVCTEVFGKSKIKEQQLKKKSPGLGMYSGGLGLDIYSDSGGESNSEEDVDRTAEIDSDEELEHTINRKRRDFEVVERDIFLRLQKEEDSKRNVSKVESVHSTSDSSSSQDEADPTVGDDQKLSATNTEESESVEVASQEEQSSKVSESYSEPSDSKSSSSCAKKKKKKRKSKSNSESSEESDIRKHRKKKKKNHSRRSRSRSRSRKHKHRSRSSRHKSRSNSGGRKSGSNSGRRKSGSKSGRRKSGSNSGGRKSGSNSGRRKSKSTSVNRKHKLRYSRSRSRSRLTSRAKRSRSHGEIDRYRSKRSRRSRSRHNRRSRSTTKYGRHRRSHSIHERSRDRDSHNDSRRRRRSRSVEVKERPKRRSRS